MLHEFRSTETIFLHSVTKTQARPQRQTDYIASVQTWLEEEDAPGEKLGCYIFLSLSGMYIVGSAIRLLISG